MTKDEQYGACRMLQFFKSQQAWSHETFGPVSFKGPKGPLNHLIKEAKEALTAEGSEQQKKEIVDCLFMVFDAAHRSGMDYSELGERAHAKLAINKQRTWPDWRGTDLDNPIEHDRSKDTPATAG